MIRSAERISLKNESLVVSKEDKQITVPLEDISIILLEDQRTTITSRLVAELASHYIGLIICDETYMPCSITLPLNMHYKQLKVFNMQMDARKPLISQLWTQIVKSKIKNQISVLEKTTKDIYYLEQMQYCLADLKSNDKTNREALAAKCFFSGVYGSYFSRKSNSEDEINAALNYGYTVLMTCMSRYLAMYGFNTIIGLHHCSKTNNYNLSSDLMEPFRPVVDRYVYEQRDNLIFPLSSDIKRGLVSLLVEPIRINNKSYLLEHAMEEMVLSLIQCFEKEDSSLLLVPEILDHSEEDEEDIELS